jgi:hypothetical protein
MLPAADAAAGSERRIRVEMEFRQAESVDRDAVEGAAGAVVLGGRLQVPGGMSLMSTERRTHRSSRLFTVVQDGGKSTLTVATRVPERDIEYFYDAARGAELLRSGVRFESVGSALDVEASLLGGRRIRLRIMPAIRYFSPDHSGAIEFTDAATELTVADGETVVIGGTRTKLHELTTRVLGTSKTSGEGESTIAVTATAE